MSSGSSKASNPPSGALDMLRSPARLAALRETELLDTPAEPTFDRLTKLLTTILDVPIALISLVDADRQFWKSACGFAEPWASARETPLSHSFCTYVVSSGEPFIVENARQHDVLCTSPAIEELGIAAYAGIPLRTATGQVIGALCAIDTVPHYWTDQELAVLNELTAVVIETIELRQRAQSYRTIVEEHPDLICRYLPDGTLTFVNSAFCRANAIDARRLLGRKRHEVLAPAEREQFEAHLALLLALGVEQTYEQRLVQPDGAVRWQQWLDRPIIGRQGLIIEIQSVGRDITERKRIEAALQASEQQFRSLCATVPVGMFMATPRGDWIYVNPRLQAIAGATEQELLGIGYGRKIHPDDFHHVWKAWAECARSGRPFVLEYRLRHPDGTVHWVCSRSAPLHSDAGELIGHVGTVEDVTERRTIEDALRENERMLSTLLSNLPGYAYRSYNTPDYTPEFISEGCFELTGYTAVAFLSGIVTPSEVIHPEDRERIWNETQAAVREHRPFQLMYRITTASGTLKWVWEQGRGVYATDGQLLALEGFCSDITAEKQAEEHRLMLERKLLETQKLESLGILAGGIAHDFNNLLSAILGNAGLALMDLEPAHAAYDSVRQIELATQRAAELTQQMLAYSGRGRFIVQPIDLNALICEMQHLLAASITKTAAVQYQLAPSLPSLLADVTQLRQVVMNLITNAAEAIGETSGTITIATSVRTRAELPAAVLKEATAAAYIELSVADTGSGMEQATLAKMFDPFFTTKFTGRGLGLAAVQGIVRGHQGLLNVQSAPGHGTTFTVWLPLPTAEPAYAEVAQAARPLNDDPLHVVQGTVLVVDDEPSVRTVVARAAQRHGLDVLVAADGQAALDLFRATREHILCVLLDLTMPQPDGEQTASAIRALDPYACIVVMSGYDEYEVLQRFAGTPPIHFLHKPFGPDELLNIIRAALQTTRTNGAPQHYNV